MSKKLIRIEKEERPKNSFIIAGEQLEDESTTGNNLDENPFHDIGKIVAE